MADRVADLYLARGAAQARGHEASGNIWANAIQSAAAPFVQLAADYPRAHAEQQKAQAEARVEQGLRRLFGSGKNPTVEDLSAIVGPERAIKIATGMQALRPDPAKDYANTQTILRDTFVGFAALPEGVRAEYYPGVRQNLIQRGVIKAEDAPEQYTPAWWQQTISYGQQPKAPEKVGTRTVTIKNPDGSETTQIVADTPGQSFTSPAPAPEKWTPTGGKMTPEEGLAAQLGYLDATTGRPQVERLTEAQRNSANRRAAANLRFSDGGSRETEWIVRDGQPVQIQKGTARPGDRPYNATVETNTAKASQDKAQTDANSQRRAQEIVSLVDSLVTIDPQGGVSTKMPGLDAVFGPLQGRMPTLSNDTADAEAIVDRIESLVTQPEMQTLRGLGPASDRDVEIIAKGATTLRNRRMSEGAARQELKRIREAALRLAGAMPTQAAPPGGTDGWVELGNGMRVREKK